MKKQIKIIILIILLFTILSAFVACQNKDTYININGDIENNFANVNLKELDKVKFVYTNSDNKTEKEKGYTLQSILEKVNLLSNDNNIMFTAYDDVSAVINCKLLDKIYVYENDDNKLCINAPDFPRAVGIKDIKEITVIAKEMGNWGIKLIDKDTQYLSYGNSKLLLYEQVAMNKKFDNVAYKYVKKDKATKLNELFDRENLVAYFTDFDIAKNYDEVEIDYKNGYIVMEKPNGKEGQLFGIVSGVDTLSYDSFDVMKSGLEKDKKVVFILPDGYSYEQYNLYKDELDILGQDCKVATTVNPAISNVSLACFLSGKSPFYNQITERGIKEIAETDIFEVAKSMDKTVSYIEGNSNLLLCSEEPILSIEMDGSTDKQVFENAKTEMDKNNDLTFIHFHGIDDVNHEYGSLSSQAKDKLIETDDYIKTLLNDFHGVVVIVPDHGHIDKIDSDGNHYGEHGEFVNQDMYIPYFVWEQ